MIHQFVVEVPEADAELAADALWALGVVAIEERAGARHGLVELWTSLGDSLDVNLPWPSRVVEVDDTVAESWRRFATPTVVTDTLVVCPAWVSFEAPASVTVVRIEPGSTFGMGDHPTTRLSLAALQRVLRPGERVLDVGCGSGVLSVGAMLLGAGEAVGIDISPAAVPVTRDNAKRNGVSVSVSTAPLSVIDGRFDVVLANILAPALVALADDLVRVVAPGGRLVISGILASAHQHVLEALEPMHVTTVDELDGWVAVELGS